jgi:CRISPR/Cas system CMR subunit Cmr6 (Cas7 group RAMP superfamily)
MSAHLLVRNSLGNRRLPGENPGLVIERLAPPLTGQQEYGPFVAALSTSPLPAAYTGAFRRWQRRSPPGETGRRVLRVSTASPLAIGLGEPVPGENGLSTLSPYGVPVIPGSALKGVVRAYAEARFPSESPWGAGGSELGTLLGVGGADGEAGAVDFLDGWIEPGGAPFVDDVITAHHARYYQSEGNTAPEGFDGPNPVHFAAVRGKFRLVLEGPDDWLVPAVELVLAALAEQGVGAKTRAGYGRLLREELDRYDQEAERTAETRRARAKRLALPASDRLAEVERAYAARSAEFEQALDAVILGETDKISIPELMSPPEGLFDREDPEVQRALAFRLQGIAERRAGKGTVRAQRFVEIVRSWLPPQEEGGTAVTVDITLRERAASATTLGELVLALVEVPGFGAALEAWGKRQDVGPPFERLSESAFRSSNTTRREVAAALGRERIASVLPDGGLKAELRKLLR